MKYINRNGVKWIWMILLIILMISYQSNIAQGNDIIQREYTKKMWDQTVEYKKEYDSNFQIRYATNKGNTELIETEISYTDKNINIIGTEAVPMIEFLNGNGILAIDYSFIEKAHEPGTPDKQETPEVLEVGETPEIPYQKQRANIPFYQSNEEIYWRVSNKNGSFGIGVPGLETPKIFEKVLPEEISGIYGENIPAKVDKKSQKGLANGLANGAVWLYSTNTALDLHKLTLDSLDLPEDISDKLKANGEMDCTLEIVVNYDIEFPFKVDQIQYNMKIRISFRILTKISLCYNS